MNARADQPAQCQPAPHFVRAHDESPAGCSNSAHPPSILPCPPLGWPVNRPSSTWWTSPDVSGRRTACTMSVGLPAEMYRDFLGTPPCRAYDAFVCLPRPARRCIDGIMTMCRSLMCSNYAHPPSILPACNAPPYIVAGGRKARPGTEVLKSRGGPARGSH